jgi:hypothetical protein
MKDLLLTLKALDALVKQRGLAEQKLETDKKGTR